MIGMEILELSGLTASSSLTYADMLGLLCGLERLDGEPSDRFLERILRLSREDRTLSWNSAVIELSVRLDVPLYPACRMSFDVPAEVQIGWSGLRISTPDGNVLVQQPMIEAAESGTIRLVPFRRWIEAVSAVGVIFAEWNVDPDAPAAHALRQSSRRWWDVELAEMSTLLPGGEFIDPSSFLFDGRTPEYELSQSVSSWNLTLSGSPRLPLRVRYSSLSNPFQMVASPVVLASGADGEFFRAALAGGNPMPEQILCILRELLERDRSYWAR